MGVPENECRDKIVSLLSLYRREKSKSKKTAGTGKGTAFPKTTIAALQTSKASSASIFYIQIIKFKIT
jgi:hypothetical protein